MVSNLSLTKDLSFSHGGPFFLSQRTILSLTEDLSFSHRRTQKNRTHKGPQRH